mgnify:CR=1 FL=1
MDDVDIVIRKYYEGKLDDLGDALSQFPSTELADKLDNLLNRVPEAMNFALTYTYGYEDV